MALKILFLISFGILIMTFTLLFINTHPPRYPRWDPPSNYGLPFDEVSFRTRDGVDLKGWFIHAAPSGKGRSTRHPSIIICHGLGANKSDFTDLGATFSNAGYAVLLFDFRAHGESRGFRSSFGQREVWDLEAALDYLKTRKEVDENKIGVFGFSMGASVALLTAATRKEIKAIVSDSAFASLPEEMERAVTTAFRLPKIPFYYLGLWFYNLYFWTDARTVSPVAVISQIAPRPVLIIGGGADPLMPPSDAERLYRAAKDPKQLWIVRGAIHGGTLATAGSDYEKRLLEFFGRSL